MKMSETLLPEFDAEMGGTRKTLERVPEDKMTWRPHKKSWSLSELATHIANLPTWAQITIDQDSFDMAPPDAPPPKTTHLKTQRELLAAFDKNISEARTAIAGVSNERLLQPWSLLSGGETLFSMPRITVLRSFFMNHIIHHRGQLGVYLRLNNVALPAIYGPTADESPM